MSCSKKKPETLIPNEDYTTIEINSHKNILLRLKDNLKEVQSELDIKKKYKLKIKKELKDMKILFNKTFKDYEHKTKLINKKEEELEKILLQIAKIKKKQLLIIINNINPGFYNHLLDISLNENEKSANLLEIYNLYFNQNFTNNSYDLTKILKDENEIKNLFNYTYFIYKNMFKTDMKNFNKIKENLLSKKQEINFNKYPFDFFIEYLNNNLSLIELENKVDDLNKELNTFCDNKNNQFLETKVVENNLKNHLKNYRVLVDYIEALSKFNEKYINYNSNDNENDNKSAEIATEIDDIARKIESFKRMNLNLECNSSQNVNSENRYNLDSNNNFEGFSSISFDLNLLNSQEDSDSNGSIELEQKNDNKIENKNNKNGDELITNNLNNLDKESNNSSDQKNKETNNNTLNNNNNNNNNLINSRNQNDKEAQKTLVENANNLQIKTYKDYTEMFKGKNKIDKTLNQFGNRCLLSSIVNQGIYTSSNNTYNTKFKGKKLNTGQFEKPSLNEMRNKKSILSQDPFFKNKRKICSMKTNNVNNKVNSTLGNNTRDISLNTKIGNEINDFSINENDDSIYKFKNEYLNSHNLPFKNKIKSVNKPYKLNKLANKSFNYPEAESKNLSCDKVHLNNTKENDDTNKSNIRITKFLNKKNNTKSNILNNKLIKKNNENIDKIINKGLPKTPGNNIKYALKNNNNNNNNSNNISHFVKNNNKSINNNSNNNKANNNNKNSYNNTINNKIFNDDGHVNIIKNIKYQSNTQYSNETPHCKDPLNKKEIPLTVLDYKNKKGQNDTPQNRSKNSKKILSYSIKNNKMKNNNMNELFSDFNYKDSICDEIIGQNNEIFNPLKSKTNDYINKVNFRNPNEYEIGLKKINQKKQNDLAQLNKNYATSSCILY